MRLADEGQQVVLKVQYPGLEQVLEQDLAQVRRILRLGRWFKVSQSRLDALFDELAESLRQELDNIMASRIGLRLWFEGTRLIAAEDLLCEWASALPGVLRRFSDQLIGLDVLLASSAGEQDDLFDPGEPEDDEVDGNPMPQGRESGWEAAEEEPWRT